MTVCDFLVIHITVDLEHCRKTINFLLPDDGVGIFFDIQQKFLAVGIFAGRVQDHAKWNISIIDWQSH